MSTTELKQLIIQSLQDANDNEAMQRVQALMDELKIELTKEVMRPLTIEEYEARIQAGLDSVARGDLMSFEDFEKEMDSWKDIRL
jgi:predicted transcriptional regulator